MFLASVPERSNLDFGGEYNEFVLVSFIECVKSFPARFSGGYEEFF